MIDVIELRFEFPNGTIIRALDYECGYEYNVSHSYRNVRASHAVQLKNYKVSGYLMVSLRDYITIKKAIDVKGKNNAQLNATFSYTGDGFQLTQYIKDFLITSQKIARQVSETAPEESVQIRFVAKDLIEEV